MVRPRPARSVGGANTKRKTTMKDASTRDDAIQRLRTGYRANALTLYVGAGASVESGLPAWRRLLSGVFINSLQSVDDSGELPVLQATGEAWFEGGAIPLDIIARELRASFSPDDFLKWVRFSLYKWIDFDRNGNPSRAFIASLRHNKTLSAIAKLCHLLHAEGKKRATFAQDRIAFGIRLHFRADYLPLCFADGRSGSVKSNAIADQLDAPLEAN
jgi:hypothetical protein